MLFGTKFRIRPDWCSASRLLKHLPRHCICCQLSKMDARQSYTGPPGPPGPPGHQDHQVPQERTKGIVKVEYSAEAESPTSSILAIRRTLYGSNHWKYVFESENQHNLIFDMIPLWCCKIDCSLSIFLGRERF